MKDEIKEILEGIEVVIKHDGTLEFNAKELKILLDYIINLQEENERLKKQLEYINGGEYLNQVKWERDFNEQIINDYKSRIDKAKEYINHEIFKRTILVGVGTKKYTRNILDNVLNILNGGDE